MQKADPHKLLVEENRRKRVVTFPILVKDRNVNAWIYSGLTHPSNFVAKLGLPDIGLEDVGFGNTKYWSAVVTDSASSIMSLSIETIRKLVKGE